MSSPDDGEQDRGIASESNERLKERLRKLEQKLEPRDNERGALSEEERLRRSSALGKAFRLSTELVAGVFVGGFLGWLLDRLLGTLPLFLVIFLLLGIAAGFMNVIRAAREMSGK
ncbi:MAG: AtpZ/AtpI family protein [Rhodomicrobium sp.]